MQRATVVTTMHLSRAARKKAWVERVPHMEGMGWDHLGGEACAGKFFAIRQMQEVVK